MTTAAHAQERTPPTPRRGRWRDLFSPQRDEPDAPPPVRRTSRPPYPATDDRTQRLPIIREPHPGGDTDPRKILLFMLGAVTDGLQHNQPATYMDRLIAPLAAELRSLSDRELDAALTEERRKQRAADEAARMAQAFETADAAGVLASIDPVVNGRAMAQRAVHAHNPAAETGLIPVIRAEIQPPLPPGESMQPPVRVAIPCAVEPEPPQGTEPVPAAPVADGGPLGSIPAYFNIGNGHPASGVRRQAGEVQRGQLLLVDKAWVPVLDVIEDGGGVLLGLNDHPDVEYASDAQVWVHHDSVFAGAADVAGVETND